MADRFAVPFQVFITDGAVITCVEAGRIATADNTTLNLSTTGGAGTFTITMASGCTGTVTSGTAAITGSVVTLSEGANILTADGAGTCTLNLTLGTVANTNSVNTYSATSGGVSGASVPTNADNFKADANSFTAGSQVLTVNATGNCLSFDFTGVTNMPTLDISSNNMYIYGNAILTASMLTTGIVGIGMFFAGSSATCQLTTNGLSLEFSTGVSGSLFTGTLTLQDNLTTTKTFYTTVGTIITGNFDISCGDFFCTGTNVRTLTMGSSTISCTSWTNTVITNLTVTANTATVNISGTGALAAGAVDYNGATFNLTGTAHTITGTPTIKELGLKPAGIQTITATGATVTLTTMIRTGTGVITIVNGTFTKVLSRVVLRNMSISGSTANGGASFYAGNSTDGGTNSGWMFRDPIGAAWK